jgi:uncharacterized membrane protein YtjA (UPF0391 family)
MKFSQGQVVFIIFFLIIFIAALAWSFLRDKNTSGKHFKGAWRILFFFLLIMVIMSLLIRYSGRF